MKNIIIILFISGIILIYDNLKNNNSTIEINID